MGKEGELEGWLMGPDSSTGTILLFHGYGGEKSGMLDKAGKFLGLGYRVLLTDFSGSGGSKGNRTTIGYDEAEQVKACVDFMRAKGENRLHLFGTSMGAVAILKAMSDHRLKVSSLMIECPFGTMSETVGARFDLMGVPRFPMASLLLFWGGVQNGFWAFSHNPVEYAGEVSVPVLLLYGEKDPKVSREETDELFKNLKGPKEMELFPEAGHENYLIRYESQWTQSIRSFLSKYGQPDRL